MSFRIPFQSNKSGLQSLKLDILGYMMEVNRTKNGKYIQIKLM